MSYFFFCILHPSLRSTELFVHHPENLRHSATLVWASKLITEHISVKIFSKKCTANYREPLEVLRFTCKMTATAGRTTQMCVFKTTLG